MLGNLYARSLSSKAALRPLKPSIAADPRCISPSITAAMPSLPSHIAGHIRFRLQEVTDSNAEDISRELCKFVEDFSEGGLLALKCCFEQMNIDVGDVQSLQLKCHIVAVVLRCLMSRPNFSTVFCEALRTTVMRDGFLENLSSALKLSTVEKIGIGLALSESENLDFKMGGQNFCIGQLEILCADSDSTLSNERIQEIFMFLYRTKGLSELVDSFTKILSLLHLKESSLSVLFPMFTDESKAINSIRSLDLLDEYLESDFDAILEEIEKEMSMADTVRDLGYGCTVNTKHCTEILSQFLPLNEITISKLLGSISRTHTGLEDAQNNHLTFCSALDSISAGDSSWANSWNADVLVESIKYLAPKTNWIRVMENLDHEGFFLPDESAFSFLISIYNIACQDPFPLHAICGSVWENVEGQLSFIRYAVTARSDVFTFEHSPRKMAYFDSVYRLNEYGNQAWFCIDLLEILCQLAERGHATTVRMILEYPLNHCPEVLLVGISQISTAYNLLQYEVSTIVFPIILKDSAKGNIIYHLWRINPNIVLRGFMDECNADPNSLLRVVDNCQELKMLSSVLDAAPFLFSIKMAAIASQKDYLNLEKWLDDNMSMHKDGFFEACLVFLKAVICDAANDAPDSSFHSSSAAAVVNNFRETCSIFLKVLQVQCGQITSSELIEEVKKLQNAFNPRTQSSVSTDSAKPEGNSDDIEVVANSYLHQMFFGELSIDAMIQMLARFKESPEKREQSIFECIVANLFEEYKFFPKYPDKQLKLAAVLFGSLIKHQLVTHLALGIALRGVLDALRKSVDSKMFIFGTKALEQFMDRLVEWPQYCNHILQISHLRGTHAEFVSVIERALARISSSQSESTGSSTPPPDQQQVSLASSGENMEVSESSWQLVGSASAQPGQQFPSFQFQQKNPDDRIKTNATSVNFSKPLLTHAVQSSLLSPPIDSASSQKTTAVQLLQTSSSQHSSTVASTASSPGFLRPSRSITPAGMLRQPPHNTGFGAALNIETLIAAAERRETPIEAPVQEIQDKILFIVNNISTTNVDAKAKEFTEVLNEQFFAWFAQYMVMKRASIEPNFHDLYLKFLERVNSRALNKEIVKATYENCKALLRSDLIKSSSEERSLLKNLGSWLGKFTIGRNQALLAREIDPKVLIIEAYEKGLMIAVIPFTSKILEPCQYSLAYQPPNPWTMGILSLLAEIYNLPNLKMNLKFDIEVLFKNLAVDMKDVKPTSLLKDRVREVEGNPDFSNKDASVAQPPVLVEVKPGVVPLLNQVEEVNNTSYASGHPSVANQYTAPVHLASSTIVDDDKIGALMIPERVSSGQGLTQVASSPSPFTLSQLQPLISNYDSYINVNPKLTSMGLQLQFQRIIQMSLDKAIREIVSPVIQRSVTIASRTTKEMVLKDLSMESDDGVILRSARMMVGALAGSLAHVTCKEPLRVSLSSHLRVVLQALNVVTEIDQIVQSITTDNLDLGCAVIENVASVKAVELIDGEIAPAFASLRKHREATGSAYYDAGTYAQGPFARIPEALRPKPGHLSVAQMQVYKDFVRTWQNQSSQSTNVMRAGLPGIAGDSASSSLPRVYGSNAGQGNNLYSSAQVAPGFSTMGQQLDTLPEESDRSSVHLLSVPLNQVGTSDAMVQHGAEVSSIMSSFSAAATASELHMEATNDMGAVVLPSPVTTVERLGTAVSESLLTAREALEKYQLVAEKLESLRANEARDAEIQGVVVEVPDIIRRCVSRDEAALAVAQKVFKSLYENASDVYHIKSHVAVLSAIRDVCKLVVKELTSWVIYSDEERKFNTEITIALIHSNLLNLAEYNVHLAKLIDGGRNKAALEFSISLVKALVDQESGVSMLELHNLIDALAKLAVRPGSPESLQQLVEICRNNTGNLSPQPDFSVSKEEKAKQSKDRKVPSGRVSTTTEESSVTETTAGDPAGFRDQVSQLFAEWGKISSLPATNDSVCSLYISQLQQLGLLKGDDITDSFFRVLTEISVAQCLATEQAITTGSLSLQSAQQPLLLTFTAIDAYAMLVVAILKFGSMDHGPSKIALLSKVLLVAVRVIQRDAEEKKSFFNPRPYFRLFVNWLLDLASPDSVLDGANFQVLTYFANTFHALQPLKVPGWSFAWLELVSHRSFMPKLLMCNSPKGWPFVQRLLVDLFKFMEPYLRNAELGEPVHFLYKGTLRVLLVLLHDFPEFLCDYHFSFCDVIPPSCIQMRNVILSAFPRNMRLPDPSTPNLKIDLLVEISQPPRILSDVESTLKAKQIKADIDDYLKTRPDGSTFLTELKQRLLLPQAEANMAGTRYNVPLINSLVLYVGMQAIQQLQSKSVQQHSPTPQMTHNPPMDIFLVGAAMDIFQSLIKSLDTEGRYLFLNAVANQLRYPNNHTHYFSFVLLYLFAEATQDIIQEQITRVLLERLIVNRPHPWGLLITFIELIKNPRYSFWSRPFTHCAPEIEKLFESVSRSCGGPKAIDDSIVAGGLPDGNH